MSWIIFLKAFTDYRQRPTRPEEALLREPPPVWWERTTKWQPCARLSLRRESHLVVDGVEGILRQHLGRLDLAVPDCSLVGQRIGGVLVEEHVRNRHARRATERAADVLERAATRRGPA